MAKKQLLLLPKPKAMTVVIGPGTPCDSGEELRCPCGYQGDIDTFDVLGADDGCVFCNSCGEELET